ncbi:MAG: serine/threonine-protein kinase [Myxococcales bacterium]|nr:serine/threonine protein kinase [Polyangiaceae bacterium]MDW8251317.1 serine/threonine-protein kinase [Myxococcales bacterium]
MHRSSFPAGETSISRIKTLILHLQITRSQLDADALLSALQLSREDLEDETRPVGVALWHRAAELFVERHGRDALVETWPGVLAPENLGVWTRVLRGAESPQDAFRQIDGMGTEEFRVARWETLESSPTRWRGRINLTHDPRFERDGLLGLARAAELRAIPAMFGLPPGKVTLLDSSSRSMAGRTGALGQEYTVTWSPQTYRELPFTGAAGLLAGASAALHTPLMGAIGAGLGLGLGLLTGVLLHRDRVNRARGQAQHYRLRTLERSSQIRESARSKLLEEGSVIAGLYRLGSRLGTGGSGVIYQATRLSDSQPVAIKLLRPAVAHDGVASDRLRREAEAMGLAWHPNVVELFDQGSLPNGTTYLVMELLRGESLAARLARLGPMSPEQILPIALELCDALSAVHSAGVIHRDIKPGNVFLALEETPSGPRERVKLLDFGIARVEWAETKLTQFGAPLGTPGYMAPEQEAGEEIDPRADLFSVGAVIFECLTGYPPAPTDRLSLPGASERTSGVLPSTPPLPAAWSGFLRRAIATNPRERFPDAKSMREALLAISRGDFTSETSSPCSIRAY